jgi:phenolic acid decarboxylase
VPIIIFFQAFANNPLKMVQRALFPKSVFDEQELTEVFQNEKIPLVHVIES